MPYMASLEHLNFGTLICGSSIINTRWVITAAHCTIHRLPSQINVRVGSIQIGVGGVAHQAFQIRIHPQFNDNNRANDISTIQTVQLIIFNAHVQPITLPTTVHGIANSVISGWGSTQQGGPPSPRLQFFNAATMPLNDCRARHANTGFSTLIQENNICAFSRIGQGICDGDNGSPLVVGRELVGVVSFGGVPCANGVPEIFTRVFSHISWVQQNSNEWS